MRQQPLLLENPREEADPRFLALDPHVQQAVLEVIAALIAQVHQARECDHEPSSEQ